MALNPSRIALEPLLALLGDRTVGTMNEVAAEFGMSPNTVKQSWRSAGMPGENGCYRLAEIVKWRLEHEAKAGTVNRFADLADKELARKEKEAEVRKLELQAERLEREEAMAKGELVAIADVNRGWTIAYANLAESLMGLPDKLTPRFPEHMAVECTEVVRRDIERFLTRLSEDGRKLAEEPKG